MKTILSNEETGALCAELAILIRAGESPMGALSNMTEVDENNDLLKKLAGDVENGMTLGEALKESGAFPAYMCGLVQRPGGQRRLWRPWRSIMRTGCV